MTRCERAGCDRPAELRGICRVHYDRERGRHRHRPERMLANRARNRALTLLAQAHPGEFATLLARTTAEVRAENAMVEAVAQATCATATGDRQVLKLRPGPRPSDEEPEDRISVVQKVQCGVCDGYHERGHKCPACEAIGRPIAARSPQERIRSLLAAGRSAQWIVDQGESRHDVMTVIQQVRRERETQATG